jgi:hypothetical protein
MLANGIVDSSHERRAVAAAWCIPVIASPEAGVRDSSTAFSTDFVEDRETAEPQVILDVARGER